MAQEKDELLDHNYDGIQEYDNDLPRWWLNIFWLTAIFAVVYTGWTHWIQEPQPVRLAKELKALEQQRQAQQKSSAPARDSASLLALVSNSEALALGKENFQKNCASCHGMNAEGLIGPNLTDDYWIHGGSIDDIRQVIQKGVVEKGMIAWEALLSAEDIDSLTAYIWTLHGTTPENAKEAEGELVQRAG